MISRVLLTAALLAWPVLAGPPLTTVQDVLYKADGTRFSGMLVITWTSFDAPDGSNVTTQSVTTKVTDGVLRVQLVPTTTSNPPVYYSVRYSSDGYVQFDEKWAVPASTLPLRVRDVRQAAPSSSTVATDTAATPPFQEADIVGLTSDLEARPLKGPGYVAGRVAMVSFQGSLESVTGSPSDCVRVDGSAGPCGAPETSYVDGDTPSGVVDGVNAAFTLSAEPQPASSLAVYRNGLLQKLGLDYSLNGGTVTFVAGAEPRTGDTLLASYRLAGVEAGASQLFASPQVLCSGVGAATANTELARIGVCTIPAGTLAVGDRVEVRFDLAHQGVSSGYHFEVLWGATPAVQRDAGALDAYVIGRADAAIHAAGAQLSSQTWGSVLPLGSTVGDASGVPNAAVTIGFLARLAQSGGETVTLRNFSVVRFP